MHFTGASDVHIGVNLMFRTRYLQMASRWLASSEARRKWTEREVGLDEVFEQALMMKV